MPDGAQVALRDLTRAREDMKHSQLQAKQRRLAFFLRQGKRFSGKFHWARARYRWMIETVKCESLAQQIVSQEYNDKMILLDQRVKAFDEHIERAASTRVFWPVIKHSWLCVALAYSALVRSATHTLRQKRSLRKEKYS